ncbi:DUF4266 domain-containing protein [Pseudoalteromonas spongiae]|uniref:DUF4266 domain-containing protein n=1 Tax=Pseudoalteromonas spongiae TaxID=298657 RepID=UPI00110B3FCB|nr:DUF4266 domain-containing protein [Pseudoalteromonas spongiae]TMO85572.1 hypothetical protein CWC15_07560 [Pseudoalteromonas spongiae]
MNKLIAICFTLLLTGCAATDGFEPWVKPYERENLAQPVMQWQLDPVESGYIHHVYQAREGAKGAEGTSGGGCGCN